MTSDVLDLAPDGKFATVVLQQCDCIYRGTAVAGVEADFDGSVGDAVARSLNIYLMKLKDRCRR